MGYKPNNCRWVTREININNTRKSIVVTFLGEEMSLHQAYEKSGSEVSYSAVHDRYRNRGWNLEDSLFQKNKRVVIP